MLTRGLAMPCRVMFMNPLPVNSSLKAFSATGSGHPTGMADREQMHERASGQRMKWPFSVLISSAAKAPGVAIVYPEENGSNGFVT